MKILFICLSNINRSQIAEAIWRARLPNDEVMSAGAHVVSEREGRFIRDIDTLPVEVMAEFGYDLSLQCVKQVTHEMVNWADRIISLTDRAELPGFVQAAQQLELWPVPDPGGKGADTLRATYADIRAKIEESVSH